MTEKRFSINGISSNYAFCLNGIYNVYDNGEILDGFKVVDLLNNLLEENEQLKKDNKELQIRNNNQARKLSNLYFLIEKKDWITLTGLIQEFQECEEQLKREEYTYCDMREEVMEGKDD